MLEAEESCQLGGFRECFMGKAFSQDTRKTLYLEDFFNCDFLTLHPCYVYPYYPLKYERPFREKNPRQVFDNTHTHLLDRELLILSEKSLQPLLLTLKGDLYPNTTHTFSECRECFGACEVLEICQKKPVRLNGCNRAYFKTRKAREDMTPRSPLVAGA